MGFIFVAYVGILFLVFMSVLAAAWTLAFQLFILSCLILLGMVFARRKKPPPPSDDYEEWYNLGQKDTDKF